MTPAAAIDELVHHSTIIELNAESYRVASAKEQYKHDSVNGANLSAPKDQSNET